MTVNQLVETTKAAKILELRMRGTSVAEIARQLETTEEYTRQVVNDQMRNAKADIVQFRDEILAYDIVRMDALIDSLMPQGLAGELKVVDRLVKLFKAKATHLQVSIPKTVKVEGGIHHMVEPVFTVNSDDYARVLEHVAKRPELLKEDTQLEDIKEKVTLLYRETGTEDIDQVMEAILNEQDNGEDDD